MSSRSYVSHSAASRCAPTSPEAIWACRSPAMWSGWRTLDRMNFHTSSLRSPRLHQLADRDPQTFLEHVAATGADAVAADVGVVDRRAEQRDELAVAPRRHEHGHVEQLTGRLVRVVGDQHVARLERVERVLVEHVGGADRQRVDVAGRAGDGLGDHAAAPVEHRVGEIAGLAHDRAERGPLQRSRLLVDGGDQGLPQDLELDGVERARLCRRLGDGHVELLRRADRTVPAGDQAAVGGDLDRPAGSDHRGGLAFLDDRRPVERGTRAELGAAVHRRVDTGRAAVEHHRTCADRRRRAGRCGDVGGRLDDVVTAERGEPPRDGLDRDVGDRQAVDPSVLGLERPGDLAGCRRPAFALADPDRDLVALAGVAGVDAVAEPYGVVGDAGRRQHPATLGAQLVEQRVAFGLVDRRRSSAASTGPGRSAPATRACRTPTAHWR